MDEWYDTPKLAQLIRCSLIVASLIPHGAKTWVADPCCDGKWWGDQDFVSMF